MALVDQRSLSGALQRVRCARWRVAALGAGVVSGVVGLGWTWGVGRNTVDAWGNFWSLERFDLDGDARRGLFLHGVAIAVIGCALLGSLLLGVASVRRSSAPRVLLAGTALVGPFCLVGCTTIVGSSGDPQLVANSLASAAATVLIVVAVVGNRWTVEGD